MQIVLVAVEQVSVLLPELFGVARSPSELLTCHLILKLLDGAVHFLILFKVSLKTLEHLVDIIVDPVPVLKLDDKVQDINL